MRCFCLCYTLYIIYRESVRTVRSERTDKMYTCRLLTKCPSSCVNMSRSIDFRQLKGKFLFGLEIYPRVFPRNGITFAAEKVKDLT